MERAMEQLNRLTRSLRRARTVELPEGEKPRGRALHFPTLAAVGDCGRPRARGGVGGARRLAGVGSHSTRAGKRCGGAPRAGAAGDAPAFS